MPQNTLTPIAKWTVEHEQIVSLHIGRWSNERIAEHFDLTPVRISQILSDPQARQIVKEAILAIRAKMRETLEDGLAELAVKGMKRIAETINFEFSPLDEGKKHQDRLSFDLAKLVYTNREGAIEDAPPLDAASFKRLTEAIEDSNAANKLIQEAEFVEVVEEDE